VESKNAVEKIRSPQIVREASIAVFAIQRLFSGRVGSFIVVSGMIRDFLVGCKRILPQNMKLIPIVIGLSEFSVRTDVKHQAERAWRPSLTRAVITTVSKFTPQKDYSPLDDG